jgi:hypothetical protein
LDEAAVEEKEVELVKPTETSQHRKPPTLQIATSPLSPTPTVDNSANHRLTSPMNRPTSPMNRPTSPAFDYSPSSPIAAAAAVTASKRSSFMSAAKRSSTHSLSTPLERHIPAYTESSSTHLTTTSTPLGTSSSHAESVSTTPENTGVASNFLGPREQEEAGKSVTQVEPNQILTDFSCGWAPYRSADPTRYELSLQQQVYKSNVDLQIKGGKVRKGLSKSQIVFL